MSTRDGAHEGLTPHDAFRRAVLGDGALVELPPIAVLRAENLAALLDLEPRDHWPEQDGTPAAYDRCAWTCARVARDALRCEPKLGLLDAVALWRELAGRFAWLAKGGTVGPSAFQWGWGVNAARRVLELPPIDNPGMTPETVQQRMVTVASPSTGG